MNKATAKRNPQPEVVDRRKGPYIVCPKCGFYVLARLHKPAHCRTRRRLLELCDGTRRMAQIARELGLSRERVRQLIRTHPQIVAPRSRGAAAARPSR